MKRLNVTQNIPKIASVADRLDKTNPELADRLDKISKTYLGLAKEAQYVGIQGYAIRNRRCFDNCLRQKRATSDKAYEELWGECHQEYLASINDPKNEKWNKYASKDDKTKDVPSELVKTANQILEVAKLAKGEEARELVKVADDMLKEAQWMRNLVNKFSPSLMNIRRTLEELKRSFNSSLQTLNSSGSSNDVGSQVKRELYNNLGQYIQEFSSSQDFRGLNPNAKKSVEQITQGLGLIRGEIGSAKQIPQLLNAIQNGLGTMDQLITFAGGAAQQAAEAPAAPATPDATDADGDSVTDGPYADTDGDGKADTPAADTDGDRVPDTPVPAEEGEEKLGYDLDKAAYQAVTYFVNNPNEIVPVLENAGYKLISAPSHRAASLKSDRRLVFSAILDGNFAAEALSKWIQKNGKDAVMKLLGNFGFKVEPGLFAGDGEAAGDAPSLESISQTIKGFLGQFQSLPKTPEVHKLVAEGLKANGWENENEALYIANWLLGEEVFNKKTSFTLGKTIKKSQRRKIV